MANRIRNGLDTRERLGGDGPPGQDGANVGAFVSVTPHGGEDLVADVRHGATPRQLVERKVLALLRGGNPGLVAQARGGPENPRRAPVGRLAQPVIDRENGDCEIAWSGSGRDSHLSGVRPARAEAQEETLR